MSVSADFEFAMYLRIPLYLFLDFRNIIPGHSPFRTFLNPSARRSVFPEMPLERG